MAGYLGNSPSDTSVRIARQIYTTSGVTTDFTFTSGYDPGYIDVYVNGERQTEGTNFTANDGSTVIILNGGVSTGSTVECAAYKTFNVATVTLGEVTDVDDLTITGAVNAGSGDIGIATIHSSGIDAGVGVITAASFVGDGSSLTGIASTDIINAEQVNVSGSTTTGIATVSTSIVVGSAVTVTATAININPTVTTTIGDSGNVDFSDDAKARFGTGNDLSIYHSGSHSFINDSGTGNLKILSSQVDILNPASNETIATFAENGSVDIYYDNSKKFETITDGVNVTGEIGINSTAPEYTLDMIGDQMRLRSNVSASNAVLRLWGQDSSTGGAIIAQNNTGGAAPLYFYHSNTDLGMTLDSSGRILIGTTTEGESSADDLTIATSGSTGITIRSGTSNEGNIFFSDGTSGDAEYKGTIQYKHADDALVIHVDVSERLRIDSSGRLLLGTTTEGYARADNLTLFEDGDCGLTIRSGSSGYGNINFSRGTSGSDEYKGDIEYYHSTDTLSLRTAATVALTIDSSQNATFTGTVSDSIGELRAIPENARGTTYTLVATDAGKCVTQTHSSGFTIDNSVFSAGDAVTMINNSGSDQTITQGSGVTLYNSADASTGNRTLASRGMATVWFQSASVGYISGAGLS